MGRAPRKDLGGYTYHITNRGVKLKPIFRTDDDYLDFIQVVNEMVDRFEPRLLSFCVLPKHWHLVLTTRRDGDLVKSITWLSLTHSARWHLKPRRKGTGGIYSGRYRSFPVQDNESLIDVMRFVESHPRRAGISERSIDWRWGSAFHRISNDQSESSSSQLVSLSAPPLPIPPNWNESLDQELSQDKLSAIIQCIDRGRPIGESDWVTKVAKRMSLESTLRPRGRPPKEAD